MIEILADLARSIDELRASPHVRIAHDEADLSAGPEPGEFGPEVTFPEDFGYACPPTMVPGLYLPDEVSVDWRHADRIAGDWSLSNHLFTRRRLLDDSVLDQTLGGIRLGDTRVVDAALRQGEPIYTLVHAPDGRLSDRLYVYDTRELFPMEIAYDAYLRALSVTKGILYWQFLYCRGLRLRGFERDVLGGEIEFLRAEFPTRSYDEVEAKWREKSAR